MADRSYMAITVYACPPDKRAALLDLILDTYEQERSEFDVLLLGERYAAEEMVLGADDELYAEIAEKIGLKDLAFDLQQDPKYEHPGMRHIYVHGLGLYYVPCTESGQPIVSWDEVEPHVGNRHQLRTQFGRPWIEAIEAIRTCASCSQVLTEENGVLVDSTGGDVCGARTDANHPHEVSSLWVPQDKPVWRFTWSSTAAEHYDLNRGQHIRQIVLDAGAEIEGSSAGVAFHVTTALPADDTLFVRCTEDLARALQPLLTDAAGREVTLNSDADGPVPEVGEAEIEAHNTEGTTILDCVACQAGEPMLHKYEKVTATVPEQSTCRHCGATILRYERSLTGQPDGHWRDEVPADEHPSGGDGFRGDATCGVRSTDTALGHEPVQ